MSHPDGLLLEPSEARLLLELAGRTQPRTGDELRLLGALTLAVADLDATTKPNQKEATP